MPSDHWIDDAGVFAAMAVAGEAVVAVGGWVTFGIRPDSPATGYGYINASGSEMSLKFILSGKSLNLR